MSFSFHSSEKYPSWKCCDIAGILNVFKSQYMQFCIVISTYWWINDEKKKQSECRYIHTGRDGSLKEYKSRINHIAMASTVMKSHAQHVTALWSLCCLVFCFPRWLFGQIWTLQLCVCVWTKTSAMRPCGASSHPGVRCSNPIARISAARLRFFRFSFLPYVVPTLWANDLVRFRHKQHLVRVSESSATRDKLHYGGLTKNVVFYQWGLVWHLRDSLRVSKISCFGLK